MNAALRSIAVALLVGGLKKLGAAPASADAATTSLTFGHMTSLSALLRALPIDDLVAIAQGRASWDDALDAAEHGADVVRVAFPAAAITAGEVKLGLEGLRFVLDLAGVGPTPFKIEPGQNPIRGGWPGARGHV